PTQSTLFPYTTLFRSGLRVEEGEHALFLVVVHEAPAEPGRERAEHNERHHHTHAQSREHDDQHAGDRDERRGAEVRLDRHEPDRSEEHTSELQSPYDL